MFTRPLNPPIKGVQNSADWPEIPTSIVEAFNRWLLPETQKEIKRRVAAGAVDNDSTRCFFDHFRAAGQLELVRYARKYRGQWVAVDLYGAIGFCGGMKLE